MAIVKCTDMRNLFYKLYFKFFTPEMVGWWRTKEAVQAKVTTAEDGSYIMWMEGEKYPFPGYPRGHLLYGTLSKLKHEVKNQILNENWWRLERGEPVTIDEATKNLTELAQVSKYDMMPYEKLCPAVKELYRNLKSPLWRDILSYIFQEDDGYRFRFQWLMTYITKKDPIGSFNQGMQMLEHAEVIDDMKERVRLVRRVMLALWKDPEKAQVWIDFVQKSNLNEMKLSKADKFYFRAKYFKVDYPHVEY
jgi:hypothetical protein